MRRLCLLGILVVLAVSSCAALNSKNWPWPTLGRGGRNPPEQTTTLISPGEPLTPAPEAPARTISQRGNGILAGQVIDAYYQRRPYSLIQVSLADGGEPPREVQTDYQGYFVIQGLTPGQRYKLLARARVGEVTLTGVTYATPPNVLVTIIVRENLQESQPAAPTTNSAQRNGETPSSSAGPQSWHTPAPPNDRAWTPAALRSPKSDKPAEPPASDLNRSPSPATAPPLVVPAPSLRGHDSSSQFRHPDKASVHNPPLAQLANPVPWPGAASSGSAAVPSSSFPVPSCRVVANKVEDFALYDLAGQPFRFREAPARLTLLDFWGTWCRPCLNSLPHLTDLQRRYGPQGLQIIGIAYEEGTLSEQQQRVNFIRQRLGLNYRILLGSGDTCPVKQQFAVQSFPTLILVDSRGNILWRCEGFDFHQLAQLENEIARRLQ
ncbi:MAG: thioredoxin-like domain-containing protein [Gemmatales bacterium]|nr:thioredoxin-like domain-containing protein [Gemmatales bacterium]MDW7993098.1 thioredoxin-like domain-containing protein [Gemmatales bacterium]